MIAVVVRLALIAHSGIRFATGDAPRPAKNEW